MLIESPQATSFFMAIVMFAIGVTVSEIFAVKMHDTVMTPCN